MPLRWRRWRRAWKSKAWTSSATIHRNGRRAASARSSLSRAGKTIYLAGVGAEDENAPAGASAPVRHLGNPYEQCRYAYDKIKRLLATHGASLADAVKQVVYVTDVRFQADVAKCRSEAYGDGPIPANTFLVINALAIPGMLLEIDVTAVVAK